MRRIAWSRRSTRSTRVSFRRLPTTCIAAKRAVIPRCAARITSAMSDALRLPFEEVEPARPLARPADRSALPDAAARAAAVDPTQNVVLEASAGTGKTRVLVERYVNLLRAGVEPDHILAITFTRKAAAEMRQRIIDRLKEASRLSEFDAGR